MNGGRNTKGRNVLLLTCRSIQHLHSHLYSLPLAVFSRLQLSLVVFSIIARTDFILLLFGHYPTLAPTGGQTFRV